MLHIAMEYLSGGDLARLIERRADAHEPFSEQEVLAIFVQLALAVHYIHAQGILHRDLKAANVFLAPGGVAKLGDFGIARVLSPDAGANAQTVIGTPYYLSPVGRCKLKSVDPVVVKVLGFNPCPLKLVNGFKPLPSACIPLHTGDV